MFDWLKIKKFQPTAADSSEPGGVDGSSSRPTHAAGPSLLGIDTDALKPHPLLSLLPSDTLERLLAGPALSEHPKGTVVFREGSPCEAIYLIVSGRCESHVRAGDGSEVEEVFGPGDTLGERAFLNQGPHNSTIIVATHAVLLRIPADELLTLFRRRPSLAGRFSQTVIGPRLANRLATDRGARVRRIVSLFPLSRRVDTSLFVRRLATSLHALSSQRVLLVHLCPPAESGEKARTWAQRVGSFNGEFFFRSHVRGTGEGYDELRLPVDPESRESAAIAPLLSHCGSHYDYVLLEINHDLPAPIATTCAIESDLSFVLMQPSTQNLYDFQLFNRELCENSRGVCAHVRPILFVEESFPTPDIPVTLKQLGKPVHSFVRGFPLTAEPAAMEPRCELHIRRLAREIARCRIGLALSSGGAKGLSHIGVVQVLEENGIEVDCVSGSSMGAYIGAIWCYGMDGQQLEKIAREHEGRWGIFSLLDPALPPRRGFLHTRRVIARLRRSIGEAHFSELIRPLRVVATHLDTLERVVFSNGEVASAVEASIAIPGVVVPVTQEGETYIDGGIADPLPVDVLEEMGIERIIAVNVIPPPERIRHWLDARKELQSQKPAGFSLSGFFNQHLNYLADGNIIDVMMQAVNGAQTRVAEASARHADVLIRPIDGDAHWHDFAHPRKYIALGRKMAEQHLSELKALAHPIHNDTPAPPRPVADITNVAA